MDDRTGTIFMPDGNGGVQPAPELMTESEAVRFLRLDTIALKHPSATLRRYRDAGQLRAVQVSRAILYPLSELRKFIERKTAEDPR